MYWHQKNSSFQLSYFIYSPASDKVTLYSTDMQSLNIYNAQGSQVSQIKLDGQDEYVLDISDLQAGVYFVKIVFGSSSQEEMMKLIKVKWYSSILYWVCRWNWYIFTSWIRYFLYPIHYLWVSSLTLVTQLLIVNC